MRSTFSHFLMFLSLGDLIMAVTLFVNAAAVLDFKMYV